MTIQTWPKAEQPREKLLSQGPGSLSDAELLAIFLRTGTRGKSAVDLSRDLLNHFGSVRELLGCNLDEFQSFPGLGAVKYTQLQAVLELGKRYLHEQMASTDLLHNSQAVIQFLTLKLRDLDHEVFACLLLNSQNQLIKYVELASGTHNESRVYPREVVKCALKHNASAVIFAHNHPSGNCEASQADMVLTKTLQEALGILDITVHDHIIIGDGQVLSFAERGWMET
jgi:DNA repair protein RadC